MKQRILRLAAAWAAVCLLLALTGCVQPASSAAQPAQEENVVVTVWSKDRHDLDFWTSKVEEYNRTNTDHITVYYQVFSENYSTMVRSRMHTGDAPDLMVYTKTVFNIMRNSCADLTSYMSEDFRRRFADVLLEGVNVFDGECYYIPTAATTCRLFYNKTLFERAGLAGPPQTMEELIEDARCITEQFADEGVYGFAINLKNAESAWNRCLMKQVNLQLGLKNGYDFAQGCYAFDRYESLLEAYRRLLAPECAYPYCGSLDIDPLRVLFAKGKIGMYFSYTHAELGAYTHQYEMADEWGVAELPTVDGVRVGAQNYNLNNGYLLNGESAHPEQAWKAYEAIFANPDNLAEYYAAGLGVPIQPELAREDWHAAGEELLLVQADERIWPHAPFELGEEDAYSLELNQDELFKTLVLGQDDIAPALRQLNERYTEAYEALLRTGQAERLVLPDFDPMEPALR